jgi:uncharacterized membrane protein
MIRALRDKPVVLAILGAACISSSGILVKLAGTSAGTTAFYRCLIALPGLMFLAMLERKNLGDRDNRSRVLAVCAGASLGVDLVLWTHAIYDVGAGIATVLGNLQVLFVSFIAWAIFSEHPRARFLVALPVVITRSRESITASALRSLTPSTSSFYGTAPRRAATSPDHWLTRQSARPWQPWWSAGPPER